MDKIRPSTRPKPRGASRSIDALKQQIEVDVYEVFRGIEYTELVEWLHFMETPLYRRLVSFYQDQHTRLAKCFLEARPSASDINELNQLRGLVKGMKLFITFFVMLKEECDERRKRRQSIEAAATAPRYGGR